MRLWGLCYTYATIMEYPARAEDGGQGAYKGGAAVAERLFPILYLELDAVGLAILLIVLFSQRRTGHGLSLIHISSVKADTS